MKKIIGLLLLSSFSIFAAPNNNITYDEVIDILEEDISSFQRSILLSDKKNTCYHLGRVEQLSSLLQKDIETQISQRSLKRSIRRQMRKIKRKSRDKTKFCSNKFRLLFGGLERNRISRRMDKAQKKLKRFEDKAPSTTVYSLNSMQLIDHLISISEKRPTYVADRVSYQRFKPEACYFVGTTSSQIDLLERALSDSLKESKYFVSLQKSINTVKLDVCRGYYMENTFNKHTKRILENAIKLKDLIQ